MKFDSAEIYKKNHSWAQFVQHTVRSPLSQLLSTSRATDHNEIPLNENSLGHFMITPSHLKPLPQIVGKRRTLKRKRVHTFILTTTPYKNYLKEEHSKKTEKENK